MRRWAKATICIAVIPCGALLAQASRDVDPLDPVYRDIAVLTSAGLIDTVVTGQWPYSQHEVERMLNEAKRNLGRRPGDSAVLDRMITHDLERWSTQPAKHVDGATLQLTYLDSPYRGIPPDSSGYNGAWINPLVANQEGRRYDDGWTLGAETQVNTDLGRHVALWADPRLDLGSGYPPSANAFWDSSNVARQRTQSAALSLLSGAADVQFGNLEVGLGRQRVVFGQSPNGGIVLSNDAPSLDGLRISDARPAPLPGFLRVFGPIKATAFIADLSHQLVRQTDSAQTLKPTQNYLVGWKATALLHPRFEVGVHVVDHEGGAGAPPGTLLERAYDLFPIVDALFTHHSYVFGDKMAGIDFRWNVPRFDGFELYADGSVTDFDARRIKSSFLLEGGIVTGWSFTCLLECGKLGVHVEYHQTGIRYYTHFTFASGYEENGFLFGDPLGPRALGVDGIIDGQSDRFGYFSATLSHEIRFGNQYAAVQNNPNGSDFHFVLIAAHPGEHRDRIMGTWRPHPERRITYSASAGVEYVQDFEFKAGYNRTNTLGQVALEIRP